MENDNKQNVDYNKTLNLPDTTFPMRAGLPQREPEMLEGWEQSRLYDRLMKKNEGKPLWILHDGPPYANASIHIGTAMNKIIKDIIVRYRNMTGYKSPYVPGWDTHGLPIELKARAKVGAERAATMSPVELRAVCKEHALYFVDEQRTQFKRLGCIGEWDNPYVTLAPEFEARQIEIFSDMAMKGYIYKGLKPVYWCPDCQTALAEAEIEYAEDPCWSVYVKFPVADDKNVLSAAGIDPAKARFVIWTTTTWTLPANTGICLGADFTYVAVEYGGEFLIMAEDLCKESMEAAGIADAEYRVAATFKGSELEYMTAHHPFLDRTSLVMVGDHVTLESGTGCVHNAPGHGVDDFNMTRNYPELEIVVPVDNKGYMTEEAGSICAGMSTNDAGKAIAAAMRESGALFASRKMIHQYPHCWRCKQPVLFRATEQWFCSVESFKDEAIEAARGVKWTPAWGEERMVSMIRERSDWCISRQRLWGVPIPVFYCEDCEKPIFQRDIFDAVIKLFRAEGSDAWYTKSAEEILPVGTKCPHCGGVHFKKDRDIMDVWFDSGTSHASVLDGREYMQWPADLYMEGGDQYRGWFQSSLLTAVAWRGKSPYRAVLSHGWTVDGEGRKMSKSLGNVIAPQEVVDKYGADILRLWVASLDYRVDVRLSPEILKQLTESYRKIRNTARFILGNLGDFNPDTDCTDDAGMEEIDRWALMRLNELNEHVAVAYESYEFHDALHSIHNFCVVDMSNFYLDVLKDRLYVEEPASATRRAAQTAMWRLLSALTKMLAPMLAYTAEEIWSFMPHSAADDRESVLFNEIPKVDTAAIDKDFMAKWTRIHALRDDVKRALEEARNQKVIGGSLDACVTIACNGDMMEFAKSVAPLLPVVLIVSDVELVEGEGDEAVITVRHAEGEKCVRCWTYSKTVGQMPHDGLCARCDAIIGV